MKGFSIQISPSWNFIQMLNDLVYPNISQQKHTRIFRSPGGLGNLLSRTMLPRSGDFRSGKDLDFVAVKSRSSGRRLAPTKPGGLGRR